MSVNPNAPRMHGPYNSSSGNHGALAGVIAAVVVIAATAIIVGMVLRSNGQKSKAEEAAKADPGSVVTSFFTSIQSKNWNALSGLIYLKPNSSNPDESNPDYIVRHDIRPLFESTNITNFTVKKWKIDGDKATVWTTLTAAPVNAPPSIKPVQSSPTFGLTLVNGQWKISTYYLPQNSK